MSNIQEVQRLQKTLLVSIELVEQDVQRKFSKEVDELLRELGADLTYKEFVELADDNPLNTALKAKQDRRDASYVIELYDMIEQFLKGVYELYFSKNYTNYTYEPSILDLQSQLSPHVEFTGIKEVYTDVLVRLHARIYREGHSLKNAMEPSVGVSHKDLLNYLTKKAKCYATSMEMKEAVL